MFSILNLLINHQKMTANELAEKLEVSKRTIYRDIEDLNLAGVPVVSIPGQGGGLGVLDNYKLDMHNNSEILENANTFIDLSSWFNDQYLKEYLTELKNAIRNKKIIKIEYQSKNGYSKRKIEPYKIVFKYASWYLFAFCLEKNDYRLFKMNRIASVEILDTSFIVRGGFDLKKMFENDPLSTNKNKHKFQVTLQYKKENEDFLMNKIGVQVFQFDTCKKIITFETANYSWVIDFIIGLKDKIQVIEPLNLVKDVKKTIEHMNNTNSFCQCKDAFTMRGHNMERTGL